MLTIVKVGGSLLDLADLPQRLRRFVTTLFLNSTSASACQILVVVGGGKVVDAIREYDSVHTLDERGSHWLSVELMHCTSQLLQLMIPEWPIIDQPKQLHEWLSERSQHPRAMIASPHCFYGPQLNFQALPIGWDTTSDSISALLARITGADELVLLKSTGASETNDLSILDEAFARALPEGLKYRLVNLRAD